MIKNSFILTFILICFVTGCKKNNNVENSLDEIIPVDAYGTNDLGFKYGDSTYIAKVYNGGWTGQKKVEIRIYNDSLKTVSIRALRELKNSDDGDSRMGLSFTGFEGLGKYQLIHDASYGAYKHRTFFSLNYPKDLYYLFEYTGNSIEITHYDKSLNELSGIFELKVVGGVKGQIHITEGRFHGYIEQ
jgi:hypothetical protein